MSEKGFTYCIETCNKLYNCFLRPEPLLDEQKFKNCRENLKNCLEVCELHFKNLEKNEKFIVIEVEKKL